MARNLKFCFHVYLSLCLIIFVSQVSDSNTLINPLANLATDCGASPEIPGHPIKLHLVNKHVNNITEVS